MLNFAERTGGGAVMPVWPFLTMKSLPHIIKNSIVIIIHYHSLLTKLLTNAAGDYYWYASSLLSMLFHLCDISQLYLDVACSCL